MNFIFSLLFTCSARWFAFDRPARTRARPLAGRKPARLLTWIEYGQSEQTHTHTQADRLESAPTAVAALCSLRARVERIELVARESEKPYERRTARPEQGKSNELSDDMVNFHLVRGRPLLSLLLLLLLLVVVADCKFIAGNCFRSSVGRSVGRLRATGRLFMVGAFEWARIQTAHQTTTTTTTTLGNWLRSASTSNACQLRTANRERRREKQEALYSANPKKQVSIWAVSDGRRASVGRAEQREAKEAPLLGTLPPLALCPSLSSRERAKTRSARQRKLVSQPDQRQLQTHSRAPMMYDLCL